MLFTYYSNDDSNDDDWDLGDKGRGSRMVSSPRYVFSFSIFFDYSNIWYIAAKVYAFHFRPTSHDKRDSIRNRQLFKKSYFMYDFRSVKPLLEPSFCR